MARTLILRAVSPVVATTLLILIAVVTAIVLYMWVNGIISQQPTQQLRLQEAIRIEAVNYTISSGKVTGVRAYVRNVGAVPVNITAIYVIDAENNTILCANISNKLNVKLDVGEVRPINVTNCNIPLGKAIIVKVVTKDGVEATYVTRT